MTDFQLQQYFERIAYAGGARPTLETLAALHTAHVFAIPFENLDVMRGARISLEPQALFDKLVTRGRGGYCFEMNGLFSLVLSSLGFRVKNLLARVANGGEFSAKTHQVLAVAIGGSEYLADVGFGGSGISAPLRLELDAEQPQLADTYRFAADTRHGFVLQRKVGGEFTPMYAFTRDEAITEDYAVANHYTSTYPQSYFKSMRFATKPTRTGRVTLTERSLKIADGESVSERAVSGEAEFASLLLEYFGLRID